MKILLFHRYDPNFPMGGAARFVLEMAAPLRDEFGVEVACATNRGELAEKLNARKIRVYELSYDRWQAPALMKQLGECIKEFRPQVIHSHHRYLTFLLDLFFRKKAWILHTEHVLRRNRRFLFRYGHHASAVSEAVRENLIRYYGVPEANVTAIPNAVRLREPDSRKVSELRQQFAGPEQKMMGLCVGRLDEQKGHTYLIRAVSRMPEEWRKRLRIFVAGEGPLKEAVLKEAEAEKVLPVFVFLGHTQEVPEYLHLCDFLVLPSLWEGMPLSVLEAYQAGKPVIATDIPGTREVVIHEKTGLLVPPKDPDALAAALAQVAQNPSKLLAMAQAVASRAREFSFETMLSRYHELYAKGIAEHGHS